MSPLFSWLLLGAVWCGMMWLVCGFFRVGTRGMHEEEQILRRKHPKVHELDDGKLALALYRGRVDDE